METLNELIEAIRAGRGFEHRGFPIGLPEPLFPGDSPHPTRWEGSAGFHLKTEDLPEVAEV